MSWVAITGGRNYHPTAEDRDSLQRLLEYLSADAVNVGDCPTGVDKWVRSWCEAGDLEVHVFEAEWERFGKGAGPRRNALMMELSDYLIAFPGGRGTASCKAEARRLRKRVYDIKTGMETSD